MVTYIHIVEYPELYEELFITGCSNINEALDIAIKNAEENDYPETKINVWESILQ